MRTAREDHVRVGITDLFMKMNVATGGKDPNAAMGDALRALGLQPTRQEGAYSEYGGHFRGRPAGLKIDGSAIVQAGNQAMAKGMGIQAAAAMGVVSGGFATWASKTHDHRARADMRNARMHLQFGIGGARPPAAPIAVGRDPSAGHPLAPGIFCSTTQEAWPHIAQPYVVHALAAGCFDRIVVNGQWLESAWSPAMSEWQHIAAAPQSFGDCIGRSLAALSALADILMG